MTDENTKPDGTTDDAGDAKPYTQAQLDKMIEGRLIRERKETSAKYADLKARLDGMSSVEEELAELKLYRDEKEGEKLSAEDRLRTKHQRDLKLMEDEANKWKTTATQKETIYKEFRKDVALTKAASKQNAIDAEQIVTLLKNNTQFVDDDGSLKLVFVRDDGSEVAVDKGVEEYLGSNPHLVRNTGPNGGGAHFPIRKGGLTPEVVSKMTRAQRKENKAEIEIMMQSMPKAKGSGVRQS